MTRQDKICTNCGSDPFKTQDYDKIVKEMEELSFRYKRARGSWSELSAKDEITIIKLEEGMRWLQRKVKKQAEAIRRLEDKLRKLNQQPYKETPCDVMQFSSKVCDNGKKGCVVTHRPPEITGM